MGGTSRSLLEPGDDRLERLDGFRLVALVQVEKELETVGFLADDRALFGEAIIETEHFVAADRLAETVRRGRRATEDAPIPIDPSVRD